jgi:hypothetical protein
VPQPWHELASFYDRNGQPAAGCGGCKVRRERPTGSPKASIRPPPAAMHPGRLASVQSWLPALACHGDGGIHSGDGAGIPAYFISIVTTFWSIEETLFADWLGVTDVLSANCY